MASYIKMSEEFHAKLEQGYAKDPAWIRIAGIIDKTDDQTTTALLCNTWVSIFLDLCHE